MRILWIKVGGLWPLNAGGRLRSFHLISDLSRRHSLTLLTTHGPGDDPDGLSAQLPMVKQTLSIPYEAPKKGSAAFARALLGSWFSELPVDLWKWRIPALGEIVERLLRSGQIELCVADFLNAMPNVPLDSSVPVVFFAHNVEHMIWKRLRDAEAGALRRGLLEIEWRKMRRCEKKACARAELTIAVSQPDRELLASQAAGRRVRSIPTGVDTSYFSPNGTQEKAMSLVFCGSMDWHPNEDAVLYFLDRILPLIRREIPGASLTVVGRNPTARLKEAAEKAGARVTGTVDDVRPYIAPAAVYVVPLRIGGGTRLKIFEALALGKAVVSTTVGAEGLPLTPGDHFIQADEPEQFARGVVSLLRDPVRRKSLGSAGRRLVEERYSWAQAAREFEIMCEEVSHQHAR